MSRPERVAKRKAVSAFKMRKGCARCGTKNVEPWELHCDHLPGTEKVDNVSDMISQDYSWVRIWEEIDKCQILCAPCHRIVTEERKTQNHEVSNRPALEALRASLGLDEGTGGTGQGEGVRSPLPGARSEAQEEVPSLGELADTLEHVLAAIYALEAIHEV